MQAVRAGPLANCLSKDVQKGGALEGKKEGKEGKDREKESSISGLKKEKEGEENDS